MGRWSDLEPFDEDFFDSAPYRSSYRVELPVPPERVWAELTGDQPLAWCRLLDNGRYTSERPYGVGTTRTMRVGKGLLSLRERYLRWDEGRRHSFYVTQATLPLFRRFGEDYLLDPTPEGCRLTWTFAHEPGPLQAAAGPLGRKLNGVLERSLIRDTRRHFRAR
ncbi:MAG: SRPBCC family protein [Micromonosporaceae bacterium]